MSKVQALLLVWKTYKAPNAPHEKTKGFKKNELAKTY